MTATADDPALGEQARHNASVWSRGRFLAHYDHAAIVGAEVIILSRYREAITRRVLDVGCGAGRMLAYLDLLGGEVHGVDLSAAMVEHCRVRFPQLEVHQGDLRDLPATETGLYDAILIPDNTLDVFGNDEREAVLADLRGLLAPGGLLIFAAHNLDCWDRAGGEPRPSSVRRLLSYVLDVRVGRDGSRLATALGPVRGRANRRRLGPMQRRANDHAIINDSAHHFSLLHYYIGCAAQRRQLERLGFDLVEVLELDGTSVADGTAGQSLWLHYIARPHTGGDGLKA
jgi:SAM-dependent methyltransferase